jgi:hypothetical protein
MPNSRIATMINVVVIGRRMKSWVFTISVASLT